MTAKEFYDKQLTNETNAAIDKTKSKFTYFDLVHFAQAYRDSELFDFFMFFRNNGEKFIGISIEELIKIYNHESTNTRQAEMPYMLNL